MLRLVCFTFVSVGARTPLADKYRFVGIKFVDMIEGPGVSTVGLG
jgi:hypothetical protein